MKNMLLLAVAATLTLSVSATHAAVIGTTKAAGVNNSGGLGGNGNHFHTSVGQSAGVNYSFGEEGRGMAEFDITGIGAFTSATLSFRVSAFADDYASLNPFVDPINVLGYSGNNSVTIGDFQTATFGLIGNFATAGLSIGNLISFDVTSALQSAVLGGTNSLGVLFDPTTRTAFDNGIRFNEITVTTAAPSAVPLPGAVWLFGSALLGLTGVSRRKRASLAV